MVLLSSVLLHLTLNLILCPNIICLATKGSYFVMLVVSLILNKFFSPNIYLLSALGLCCRVPAFPGCVSGGHVCRSAWVSLAAEHRP